MTAKKIDNQWYFDVWSSGNLEFLHILACRVQNMGRSTRIDPIPHFANIPYYRLRATYRPGEIDRDGYPQHTNSSRLLKLVDSNGHSKLSEWEAFWSREPATDQEIAWAVNKPLYNE